MKKSIIIVSFLFSFLFSCYSQLESEIYNLNLQSYNGALKKIGKEAFKELRRLDNSRAKPINSEIDKYKYITIVTYPLNGQFYRQEVAFEKNIDFSKIRKGCEVSIFKDTAYLGYLNLYLGSNNQAHLMNFFFSSIDSRDSLQEAAMRNHKLSMQIINFEPDMVFFIEDLPHYIFLLKKNKLYVGKQKKLLDLIDSIAPIKEYLKDSLFINKLTKINNKPLSKSSYKKLTFL